ncbi:MAG TPA: DUF2752 domain-containing protein [Actinomycetota bacterium]|nr:DUF2752 domain-containing protein [Actinomycetota bacterium]
MWAGLARRIDLSGFHLQVSAGLLLLGAFLWPLIPGHIGLVCPLRATTGIPCPLCGMTTSVVATGRGRFSDALAANPGGLVAVAAAVILLLFRPKNVRVHVGLLVVVLTAMWVFELFRFSVL